MDKRAERETRAGRETCEDREGLLKFCFSRLELFVTSFVSEGTSDPDESGPDVRCELKTVQKLRDLAEGVRQGDERYGRLRE